MNLRLTGAALLAFALLGSSSGQQGAATGEPIVLSTAPLPRAFLRQPYHFKLEAQGGITPLKWEVTNGSPPEGIELAPDGTLSGTPTEVDSFHFVVTVTDSGKPVAQKKKGFVLEVVAPLVVEWSRKPTITGHRLEAAIRVSNQTGNDFDFTFIALAVNENGRATAVGYQHFTLKRDTDEFEIPFAENLPQGSYDLNVDTVGEVESTNTIVRARLAPTGKLQVVQGP
ncbi:MAG TPA: Ig domain-containing protein [Terriglobales bacterium]|nr:Ig domain-containing protein [Terriglobales bacterium]